MEHKEGWLIDTPNYLETLQNEFESSPFNSLFFTYISSISVRLFLYLNFHYFLYIHTHDNIIYNPYKFLYATFTNLTIRFVHILVPA